MRRAWLALLLVACSSDDAIDVDAGDATPIDAGDARSDVPDVVSEPSPPPPPPPPPAIAKFQQQAAQALCGRLAQCCSTLDAGAFDFDACAGGAGLHGWEDANAELLVPGVIDGGLLSLDQTSATSCLAGLATMSCSNVSSPEFITLDTNCYAAVSGKSAIGGPCRADVECVKAAYCDALVDGGTCVALVGQDAACQRTDQCAYKGGLGALYCNGSTCEPRLPLDASCAANDACESSICANAACASSYAFNACAFGGGP